MKRVIKADTDLYSAKAAAQYAKKLVKSYKTPFVVDLTDKNDNGEWITAGRERVKLNATIQPIGKGFAVLVDPDTLLKQEDTEYLKEEIVPDIVSDLQVIYPDLNISQDEIRIPLGMGRQGRRIAIKITDPEIIQAGTGTGRKTVWYIGTYPDREVFHTDGFQTNGFSSEEEAQAALDEIYSEEYYRNRYPGLQVLSKITYSVWHE